MEEEKKEEKIHFANFLLGVIFIIIIIVSAIYLPVSEVASESLDFASLTLTNEEFKTESKTETQILRNFFQKNIRKLGKVPLSKVNEGSYGKVYSFSIKCKNISNSFAVKIASGGLNSDILKTEYEKLKDFDESFVVPVYCFCKDKNYSYMIMKYYSEGNLWDKLTDEKTSDQKKKELLKKAARSISELEKNGFILGDFKFEHFMIDSKNPEVLPIIDGDGFIKLDQTCSRSSYLVSPEISVGSTLTFRSNSYSFILHLYLVYFDIKVLDSIARNIGINGKLNFGVKKDTKDCPFSKLFDINLLNPLSRPSMEEIICILDDPEYKVIIKEEDLILSTEEVSMRVGKNKGQITKIPL